MKHRITTRGVFIGALAAITSLLPALSGTAQAKHGGSHGKQGNSSVHHSQPGNNGLHLGWEKGKHKGWSKNSDKRDDDWRDDDRRDVRRRPTTRRNTTRNTTRRTTWTRSRPVSNHGAKLSTRYYNSRAAAEAAALHARRNGNYARISHNAPSHRWVVTVYRR